MRAIVTLVLTEFPKYKPKITGTDVFGRLSTDADSRHKCILIENAETLYHVKDKALAALQTNNLVGRILRIEVIQ